MSTAIKTDNDDSSYYYRVENGYKISRYPINWKQLEERLNDGSGVGRSVN